MPFRVQKSEALHLREAARKKSVLTVVLNDLRHNIVRISRARTYGIQPSGPTSDTTNFRTPSSFCLLIEGKKIEVSSKQEQATQNYSCDKLAEPSDKMTDWKPTRPESMKDKASLVQRTKAKDTPKYVIGSCCNNEERRLEEITCCFLLHVLQYQSSGLF